MNVARSSEYKAEWYDDIKAGYYDRVYARGRGIQWFWHHHRFLAVADLIPQSAESILDIGCGPGTFLGHFARNYQRGTGIDLAEGQIEFASRKYGSERLRFQSIDVADLALVAQHDVVTSIEVIEHLPSGETQQFLRSIWNALKPGGTVVLTTPNYRSAWPVIEWIISRTGPVDYVEQHITHFSLDNLRQELEKAGFVVDAERSFFVIAPFVAAISGYLARLVYAAERRLMPRYGSEIAIRARKPAASPA